MSVHLSRRARTRVAAASGLLLALDALSIGTQAPVVAADDTTPDAGSAQDAGASASIVPLTPDGVIDAEQPSSRLAKTPPSLLRSTDPALVPVMIKYDYDAVASYTGTIKGLEASSPSATGDELTPSTLGNTSAAGDYTDFVDAREAAISARVREAVPGAEITGSFQVVYGGVSALVPGDAVADLLAVPGVVAVHQDAVSRPTGEASAVAVRPRAAYDALGATREDAGAEVLFGSLDSGVWPEHPSLADDGTLPDYTGARLPCEFGDNPQTVEVDVFQCNDKLVGGDTFLDTYTSQRGAGYPNPGLARDGDGHGTHTTTTAAGDVVDASLNGRTARLYGVAPGAQVVAYRVCALNSCYSSDSAAAVQQAILDGVDVLNFSVSGGTDPATDPVELAFLDAYNAGIFVATSGGNKGPGAGTTQHLSPWVSTVAATTWAGVSTSRLTLTADNGETFTSDAASSTAGAGPLPLVLSTDPAYNRSLCDAPAAPGTFTGKVVVCQRGTNGRVEKGYNVLQGGAAAMILANVAGGATDTIADNHWLPTAHVATGPAMMAFISSHTGITAELTAGERGSTTPAVATFSSRGPAGGFIKPDVAAPGVAVLAGVVPSAASPSGGPAQSYQNYDGTSMAAPHVAGSAILLRALHPDWTPGQIRSVLTTTGRQATTKHDSAALATPFDVGTGRLDVRRAVAVPLTIADTGANFTALTSDPLRRVDLNIPSINVPSLPGGVRTTRTVENVSSAPVTVTALRKVQPGTTIEISPRSATVAPGETATFTITVTSTAPLGVQQFATIRLATDQGSLQIPVAYVRKPTTVDLQQRCDDASVAVGATTTCHVTASNEGVDEVQVDLTSTQLHQTARITGAQGATRTGNSAATSATLAGRRYSTPSLESTPRPSAGFLDLTGTVSPQAVGDDNAVNFTVPGVRYGGNTYTTLGVVSNGYVVLGGATSSDVVAAPPPTGASVSRPNNIVAPFWADLDGTNAPGIRVATVTPPGTTDQYVVVQWDVKVYTTTDARTFQVWLKVGDDQDVRFEYPSPPTAPSSDVTPYGIGAENEVGAGVLTTDLPTESLRVLSTPPTRDSVSYDVTVRGRSAGTTGVLRTVADVVQAGRIASRSVATTPIEVTP